MKGCTVCSDGLCDKFGVKSEMINDLLWQAEHWIDWLQLSVA